MKSRQWARSVVACFVMGAAAHAEDKSNAPDVRSIASAKGWKLVNREVTAVDDAGKHAIRFDERADVGIAWLDGSDLDEGVIEVDVKGQDVDQHSFLGIAFRGVDEQTHDAVYFRPFNFKSDDPVRRTHAVQYVSHPNYPWKTLRDVRTGIYEKAVDPAPDPNGWFHARIVISKRKVSVFVNDAKAPCLTVDELSDRRGGRVGLWVGDGSGGTFANLEITPAK
ncbi:MAG: hypothetical protein HYR85_12945 [Planctomycetes bacterium]|nr:hypothetical protein [Planctomycetota bacterium]MBI3847883.1 hypothetical protein [Planctomycetota bacterium]